MKRLLLAGVLLAAFALPAAPAAAHPLGNFSVNHLTQIRISSHAVELRYVLDQAEIPTFEERGLPPAAVLARKRAEVARSLRLTVDGRAVALRLLPGATISFPPGQGGLKLTRVELALEATVTGARSVGLYDGTFPDRIGWKAVVAAPGTGTAVTSTAPSGDPTRGLRSYPQDMLSSPLDERSASFTVAAGSGTLVAPRVAGGHDATTGNRSGDGFAAIFADAAAGRGVLVLLVLAALGWGALHALSPGHGKAMVAAYLVGARGTARHALGLGLTVTISHTIGVFTLGAVTLLLSHYVLPEQLYPWLTLASGLMVLLVGLGVLRGRVGALRRSGHAHHHHHHHHEQITWRGLVAMGGSAGIIPCPSALVVLLAAIAQHQVALGLLLILCFSLGIAGSLTALGMLVVYAKRVSDRIRGAGRIALVTPAVSAIVIVVAGVLLTAQAVPKL